MTHDRPKNFNLSRISDVGNAPRQAGILSAPSAAGCGSLELAPFDFAQDKLVFSFLISHRDRSPAFGRNQKNRKPQKGSEKVESQKAKEPQINADGRG